jgi:hypothetical protein
MLLISDYFEPTTFEFIRRDNVIHKLWNDKAVKRGTNETT